MGRPKLKPEARRVNVALTLPAHLLGEAKAIANLSGISMSKMVEMLLENAFSQLKKRCDEKIARGETLDT